MFVFSKLKADSASSREAEVISDVSRTAAAMFSFFAILRLAPFLLKRLQ
jgi:hypothetical protein